MGRVLTAIGVLLVAIFVAAAAAPFLVDWTRQKDAIEREASKLLGLPVVIDGAVDLRFLPSPVVTLGSVRIGSPGGEARVESITLDLSVASLLRGEIHVAEARLLEPKIWIALDREGRFAGAPAASDLSAVAIDRIEIEGGEITLEDPREGARFFVDGIAFGGTAQSALGPWRGEGGARFEGTRVGFTLQTSRMDATGGRVRLVVEPVERPVAFEFEGALAIDQARPVLGGTLRLRGVGAEVAEQRDRGARVEATVEARPERIVARDLKIIQAAGDDRQIQLAGTVNVALGARPRLDAVLSARQLDLDRLTAGPQEADVPARLARLFAGTPLLAVPPLDGRVRLDIASLVLAGGLIQEARLDAEARAGRWRLTQAEARLPGQATFRASGDIGARGGPLVFDGPFELAVTAPGAFIGWLDGELSRPTQQRAAPAQGAVRLAGRASLGPDRFALADLTARVGTATMRGEVEYDRSAEPARLRLRVGAPEIDAEPIVTLVTGLAPRLPALGAARIDAELRADRLRWRDLDARGVDVALAGEGGAITAERLRIGALNGLAISGRGGRAANGVWDLGLRAEGASTRDAVAALAPLLAEAGIDPALVERLAGLRDVAADFGFATTATGRTASMTGRAGATTIEARLAWEGAGAVERALIALSAPSVAGIFDVLGVPAQAAPGAEGASRLTASLARAEGGTHTLDMSAELAGVAVGARGPVRLAGTATTAPALALTARARDAVPLLLAFGLPVVGAEERLPFDLAGRLTIDPVRFAVSGIEGTVSGAATRGDLALTRDAARALSGRLEIAETTLDRISALAAGPWPVATTPGGWAGTPFGQTAIAGLSGTVDVSVGRLGFDRLELREARFVARPAANGLTLERFQSLLAGGRVQGEISLARPEAGLRLSGRLQAEGLRLEDLVWRVDGRPVAAGALDGRLTFDGAGRSPVVLVGALSGEGTFAIRHGEARGLAHGALAAGVRAGEAGMALDERRLSDLVRTELDRGPLTFERLEGTLALQAGVARATNLTLDGAPVSVTGRAAIDLARWAVDADWAMEAPGARPGERGPRIGLLFTGPLDAPERRVEVRPFLDFINLRRFEREVERLEVLQRQQEEQERRIRDMEASERERRLRQSAPPEAPAPPATSIPQRPAPAPATTPVAPRAAAPPASAPPSSVPPALERQRLEGIVQDALRRADPPAAAPALAPLPPPIVVAPAPAPAR
jgi:uncharacterized protein involved in outer membrane biogenesis